MPIDPKKLEELKAEAKAVDRLALRCAGTQASEAERRAYRMGAGMLAQQVPALIGEVERLRSLLREAEWASSDGARTRDGDCPLCGASKTYKGQHEPGCRLAAELR